MPAVTVTAAKLDDVARVLPMYEWLFVPPGKRPPDWDADRAASVLGRAVSSYCAIVLVATLGSELVGVCTAYDDLESVRFGRRVWIEDLVVHPDHRSAGIGKQLLDEAKQWASARGAARVELESAEARTDAHRFYNRQRPAWRSVCFGWEL